MGNDAEVIWLQRHDNYTGLTASDGRVLVSVFSRLKSNDLVRVLLRTTPTRTHARTHAHTHTHTQSVFFFFEEIS